MKALFLSAALFTGQNKQMLLDLLNAQDRAAQTRLSEMQDDGTIVYEGEDEDTGVAMYTLFLSDTTIHYAYEPEVLEFLKTGTFEYNDFLVEGYQSNQNPQQ